MPQTTWKSTRLALLAAASSAALALEACSPIERTPRPDRSTTANAVEVDVPQIMAGTVAAEAVLDGYQPVIVHGYGLVVGLAGTGSNDVPPEVRAHILAIASRHGIGSERSGWGSLSPEALIDSPDTAVVIVEGIIPPGAPEGTAFDVRVTAHPTSSTTSLEGGRLYTTDLLPAVRPDVGLRVLPPTGSLQPAAIATASGPLFINPFADPGATERDTIDRRNGWILNGGWATRDMPLKLRLFQPSHTRASLIQDALNTRFPQEPGQQYRTAQGESDEAIAVSVPPSYRTRTEEFVELLRHTTIRQFGSEQIAETIRRYVIENPATALDASWRWQALGQRALPTVRELYDDPEELPRLAALRAGASLGDPLVTPHLVAMAESGSEDVRRQAIELLGDMGIDPVIDRALRKLVNDPDVETRLAAYEALVQRGDPSVDRIVVDEKFVVDVVDSDIPMIYITQVGLPRLAVFGRELAVDRPVTVTAWSQRFMMIANSTDDRVQVYYRPPDAAQGSSHLVRPQVAELIRFLGHTTMPDQPVPGLGLSYSQVIGVLHQIWRQGYLHADFKAEQDRILAAIVKQRQRTTVAERPEVDASAPEPEASDMQEVPPPAEGGASGSSG